MNAKERVLAALNFQKPDRIPLYDSYWPEFVEAWRHQKKLSAGADISDYYQNDVAIVVPQEAPFPSQEKTLESGADGRVFRTMWGATVRRRSDAKFDEVLEVALPDKGKADRLEFEPPLMDSRYRPAEEVEALQAKRCVFVKTGGPYLRTSNLRGSEQWLMDLAEDPDFAHELAMRVTRHITAVGLEALRRYGLWETGIWFFDDMASNLGPMCSPKTFERVFLPCYAWMCSQYRSAGAKHILLHCDGHLEPLLDMLIDVGIQACHPMEPKAGMDVVRLREKFGRKLAFLGGLDNAHILARAPLEELKAHVQRVLGIGREGGLVVGGHSIGPDISVERYDLVNRMVLATGGT